MATKKFSQFTNAPTPTEETFFVGYNSATNLNTRTSKGNLLAQGVKNTSTDTLPFAMYSNNYLGVACFGPAEDENKFVVLAASAVPTDYLTFQFIGGSINGINIAKNNPLIGTSITLTPATVTFEDNGFGLVPNQYTDFVNTIMESLNLVSRVVTKNRESFAPDPNVNGYPYWNQMNYCDADTFFLLFQETGAVQKGGITQSMTQPYGFQSYNGLGGFNFLGFGDLNDFGNMRSNLQDYNFSNQNSFIQQY